MKTSFMYDIKIFIPFLHNGSSPQNLKVISEAAFPYP